jgi:hypothetical protein
VSIQALLVHDVVIVTAATTTGRYGDAVKDWDGATRTTVKGWLARKNQQEVNGTREAEVYDSVLFLAADATITGADRVEWQGGTYEVAGPPNQAWTPRGEHHLEVPLRRVDG